MIGCSKEQVMSPDGLVGKCRKLKRKYFRLEKQNQGRRFESESNRALPSACAISNALLIQQ